MKIAKNLAITLVCIILGIMLALQYKSINYNQSMSALQYKRLDELKDDYIKLQNQKTTLQEKLKELENENQIYENANIGSDEYLETIQKKLKDSKLFAGLIDVHGKGIIVILEDNDYLQVEDIDILNVVNELRASGAQAISVNDERIVAMSEIRSAGSYIMVNGKQMSSPFTIRAISDPLRAENSLRLIGGVLETLEELQIKVDVKKSDNIKIPKFIDDGTTIKYDLLLPTE